MNNSSKNEGPSKRPNKFKSEDRPFKKFEKNNKEKRDYSNDRNDRPFQKDHLNKNREDRPFQKGGFNKNREDRPFQKDGFNKNREGNFSPKEGYQKRNDGRTFQKGSFKKGGEDRPFQKRKNTKDEDGFKRNSNFSNKKTFSKSEGFSDSKQVRNFDKDSKFENNKGFKKSFKEKQEGFENKRKNTSKPNKGYNLRQFEEQDLSFGSKKSNFQLREEKPKDEISFSKSIENLEKWESAPIQPPFGKLENHLRKRRVPKEENHKFKQYFDDENDYEKAYASFSEGKKRNNKDYFDKSSLEGEMPLNKFISHCGVCSRRDAVELIKSGKVKVNDELIVEPFHRVTQNDKITLSGKKLLIQKNLVYILLNKPKGYITTLEDPKGRRTVMDIFGDEIQERIYPVGRLDRNTTGVLILTNDGELAQKLAHPKFEARKVYQVTLDKDLTLEDFQKIRAGVLLEDGPAPVDQLEFLDAKNKLGLEIHSGRNRIVRRIFESLGYVVEKLDRVMYAGLTKKNVVRGKWRFLTKQEVINLKHFNPAK